MIAPGIALRAQPGLRALRRITTTPLRQFRGADAGNPNRAEWLQPGHDGPAAFDGVRAARVERTARRRIERRWQLALERDALPPRPRLERRRAREQRPGVGMRGPAEHSVL